MSEIWRQHLIMNIETASAFHVSGLVVRFLILPLSEEQKQKSDRVGDVAMGKCWTEDGREWGIVTTSGLQFKVFEALKEKHGVEEAQTQYMRLGREAGELWVNCKRREH